MAERDVHVEGLTELLAKFQALVTKAAKGALRKACRAGGEVFKQAIIERTPVKTGQLRDDIINATQIDANEGTGTASAGPTRHSFYGEFEEFGTSHQPARTFMRPAFDAGGEEALQAFVNVMTDALDEASR